MTKISSLAWASIAALALAGCGPSATTEAASSDDDAAVSGQGSAGAPAADGTVTLSGSIPPDACLVLTEARAAEILMGAPSLRPGAACAYAAGAGSDQEFVRLLFTSLPLDQVDVTRDSADALAATLGGFAQIGAALTSEGDVAGGPAFSADVDGTSVLFTLPGVRTTAMTSDRPVGEVIVQASLSNAQSHDARLDTLKTLASQSAGFLRDSAAGGG